MVNSFFNFYLIFQFFTTVKKRSFKLFLSKTFKKQQKFVSDAGLRCLQKQLVQDHVARYQ